MLSQLCRSGIPDSIVREYRQATELAATARSITVDRLSLMLKEMVLSHDDIAIIVDGIDEAAEPDTLCRLLFSQYTFACIVTPPFPQLSPRCIY